MIWIAGISIIVAYIAGKYQGWTDGVKFTETFLEHYVVARGWGTYRFVNGGVAFEVFENDRQRTVDSDSGGKEVPPTEPAGG